MKTPRTVTISVPPAMRKEMEKVRRVDHRTTSELIREAWRVYFAMRHAPGYTPTASERRAIERGRAAFRRGDFVTLDQFKANLDRLPDRPRGKDAHAPRTPRARSPRRRAS